MVITVWKMRRLQGRRVVKRDKTRREDPNHLAWGSATNQVVPVRFCPLSAQIITTDLLFTSNGAFASIGSLFYPTVSSALVNFNLPYQWLELYVRYGSRDSTFDPN